VLACGNVRADGTVSSIQLGQAFVIG